MTDSSLMNNNSCLNERLKEYKQGRKRPLERQREERGRETPSETQGASKQLSIYGVTDSSLKQ